MAEVSTIQMALTRNTEFMERHQVLLAKVAGTILSEPGSTPYHQSRAFYAQKVISQPSQTSVQGSPITVMHTNIATYTVYDEPSKTSTTTAPDLNIENSIIELWNVLAGIDTPS